MTWERASGEPSPFVPNPPLKAGKQDIRTLRRLSEAFLDQQVLGIAHENGWKAYHVRDSRRVIQGDTGYPDGTLARNGQVVIMECKTEQGVLEASQLNWLVVLGWLGFDGQWVQRIDGDAATVRVYVVRPSDWDERRIHAVLK